MDVKPSYGPPRPGDVQANYLSYALAKRELGWAPKVGLDEGIRNTVEFFKTGAKR
jgi:UDP-glucose 4-epimerase